MRLAIDRIGRASTFGKGMQMRMCWRGLPMAALLFVFGFAQSVSAVTLDWTNVGNPGNACDTQAQGCFGSVGSEYRISTYEVTNAQYAEFLNAKAGSDPFALYNASMGASAFGGITQSGVSGSFTYSAIAGRESQPVTFVSFYDSLRFANWLNNGQGGGDTETGSYTLLGGSAFPSNGDTVTRNAGARIFLPSEDEWYKAAYYDAVSTSFFDYPAGTNTPTVCSAPTATANSANCKTPPAAVVLRDVGSYTGSASPYGTFDQGGNVWEWNEDLISGTLRGRRGGAFDGVPLDLAASTQSLSGPLGEFSILGLRVAMVPEPSTGVLMMLSMLGLARWRRPDA
jgi:formylglycine-generating enzyme